MSQDRPVNMLQIKKYPNRRYYDATRSRHITLQEVYELIRQGFDVMVTDSRNGEDITNVVLLQILLEKEHPKLDVFPSSILHMMVRTNHQALRATVDAMFGPFLKWMSSSQRQFDSYWRQMMSGHMTNPLDWTDFFTQAFHPQHRNGSGPDEDMPGGFDTQAHDGDADEGPTPAPHAREKGESLDELRRQVSELTRRLESFDRPSPDKGKTTGK